ncbi:hypothetical protein [Verrucomicrobium sp. BvORR106]|uniref:hypothetical protein n=1 Tax=Verrucomicrobium sp. BvORR106 TaxID=1403819 RepID=UPI002240F669|nr:hypothetical protein [Verrucomicrobium sp. BvORR106]
MPPDSSPFDPDLDKRQIQKQTRRALLLILGFILALMITFIGLLLFYDVPMPDDSSLSVTTQELQLPAVTSQAAKNPLADLVNALKAAKMERVEELPSRARTLEPGTEAEVRTFLATQGQAFAAFDTLLHSPQAGQWRWPELGTEPATRWTGESISSIQNIANLIRLRYRLELADGEWEKCLYSLTSLIQFGSALQRRPGTLIHLLVAGNAQRMGESGLEAALTLQTVPADRLAVLQQLLTGLEQDRTNYELSLRIEYAIFKEMIPLMVDAADLQAYHGTKLLEPFAPLLLKPGMSCTVRAQHDQATIATLHQGWKEGLLLQTTLANEFEAKTQSQIRRLLSANPVGDYHHLQYTGSAKSILGRQLTDIALHRQTVLQLALRRYELDHGQVPDQLTILVPQYLPEVPLDPFTDLPMTWLPATQVLYSIGEDFTDNGGTFTKPASRRGPDLAMHYWWSDAAAKWREEQRLESQRNSAGRKSTKKKSASSKPAPPQAATGP